MEVNMKKLLLVPFTLALISTSAYSQESIKIGPQDNFENTMHQQFSDIFNNFFNQGFSKINNIQQENKGFLPLRALSSYPRTDMYETDKEIKISIEIPGIDKDDIDLQIQQDMVSIKYSDKGERERKTRNYTINERSFASFQRQIALPSYADYERAEADYENGVLEISIPKTKDAKVKPKKIEIN
jgi:HSP20 family protein